jgi:hypothetical protein
MFKESRNPCKRCESLIRYVSNNSCVECSKNKMKTQGNAYSKKYYDKNKEKICEENRNEYGSVGKRYVYMMLKRAQKRAVEKEILFDLCVDDIHIPEFCPILGIKLNVGKTQGPDDFSPSLDRIIPEKGYTKTNIKVISMRANRMKSNATIQDVENLLNYLKINIDKYSQCPNNDNKKTE